MTQLLPSSQRREKLISPPCKEEKVAELDLERVWRFRKKMTNRPGLCLSLKKPII